MDYKEASRRTKSRKRDSRVEECTTEEAIAVAVKKMKLDKNVTGAKILEKHLTSEEESLKCANKIQQAIHEKMSVSGALNMSISRFLSKGDYIYIRKAALLSGNDFLPSWDLVSLNESLYCTNKYYVKNISYHRNIMKYIKIFFYTLKS